MQPSPHATSGPAPAHASGFALLAILLIIAALVLIVGMSLQTGLDSRRVAAQAHNEQLAAAVAEAGLERTRAYLHTLLESHVDLDRALDPELDTDCNGGAFTDSTSPLRDDNIPLLGGTGQILQYPATAGGLWYKFVRHGEGGYLVRIDDNEDDAPQLGGPNTPLATTTNNNVRGTSGSANCTEGTAHNPVRDRDRSVLVTVIGFYPLVLPATLPADAQLQALLERAQARKVLRARVGPTYNAGLIVGGDLKFGGNSRICGEFGNVIGTGSLNASSGGGGGGGNAELCGTNCTGGATSCTASAANGCNLSSSGSGSSCQGGADVPRPPPVHVWSSVNAPPPCYTDGSCIPFYYLRHVGNDFVLFMWNYEQCESPQANPVIPTPETQSTTAPCWVKVYDPSVAPSCTSDSKELFFVENAALRRRNPSIAKSKAAMDALSLPLVFPDTTASICPTATSPDGIWTLKDSGFKNSESPTCERSSNVPYPDQVKNPDLWYTRVPKVDFEYKHGALRIPHGVWLVEGNVHMEAETAPPCGDQPAVSIMATGDMKITGNIRLDPAHPRGYILLTGRDLTVETGNTVFGKCNRMGAIMVHEQILVKSNSNVNAQLVVEDAASCSKTAEENEFRGDSEILVDGLPPISAGNSASLLSWSDSAL